MTCAPKREQFLLPGKTEQNGKGMKMIICHILISI